MRRGRTTIERSLAIDPTHRGFGFAVLEGPDRLIDWGLCYVTGDTTPGSLRRLADLLRRYRPDTLVLEDCAARTCRRGPRVRNLLGRMAAIAAGSRIRVHRVSSDAVRRAFSTNSAAAKHDVATRVAARFPELLSKLPKPRKPWQAEDERMAIFGAAGMGTTWFDGRSGRT